MSSENALATAKTDAKESFSDAAMNHYDLLAGRARQLSSAAPAAPGHNVISFDSGHAFPGVLPDLAAEADAALSQFRPETLQYAPRPGLAELRQWIADYTRADGGCDVTAENVLVTNGAKHALELVCRLFLDPGDPIVVTSPTYFTAIPIFKSYGVEFIEISQDCEGLCVAQLEEVLVSRNHAGLRPPKFIYDVPDFHNPTGVTMSRGRREALIALAERNRIFLVEDSPYRKVRFESDSLPSLKALDQGDCVLSLGTFSKLLAPGMRVGWVAASPALINRMIQLKSDGGSCPLTQRIILEFCKNGRLQAHIARVQQVYREHRDCMVAAVRRELREAAMKVPHGGYYVWLTLPKHVDGDLLALHAQKRNVVFIPGSKFFAATGTASRKRYIRLAYSHATPREIDEGVKILGEVYRTLN
jgi:2-aminoadipate transaminase